VNLAALNEDEKRELYELMRLKNLRFKRDRLANYKPYTKQKDFHHTGTFRERLFMAGNQLGKTWAGAFEVAMHVTGIYPDWWGDVQYQTGVRVIAAGASSQQIREAIQDTLLGTQDKIQDPYQKYNLDSDIR
jgi:hypothetical protein